jgi:hypothetical protein
MRNTHVVKVILCARVQATVRSQNSRRTGALFIDFDFVESIVFSRHRGEKWSESRRVLFLVLSSSTSTCSCLFTFLKESSSLILLFVGFGPILGRV